MILVWYKGRWHIAQYGQNNGYPQGQGISIVRFLTNTDDRTAPGEVYHDPNAVPSNASKESTANALPRDNVAALKAALDNDLLYTPTTKQTEDFYADAKLIHEEARELQSSAWGRRMTTEQYLEYENKYQLDVGFDRPMMLVQPALARECGVQILSVVAYAKEKVPIELATEFVVSNSCERAYVVDLDDQIFEVHLGATNRIPNNTERFDGEDFMQEAKNVPKLLVKYTFGDLEGMTVERLTSEVNAAKDEWEYDSDLEKMMADSSSG